MLLTYTNKTTSNKIRQSEYLSLPRSERVNRFLTLMEKSYRLFGSRQNKQKHNFELIIEPEKVKKNWQENIDTFIALAAKHQVRMIMVGGGAVNFHGYQRHSADVDFWIDTSPQNLKRLITVFKEMHYDIDDFPDTVKNQQQNISVKFSPDDLELELITKFSINKTFEQAYNDAEEVEVKGKKILKWKVLNYEDLINSKIKANRPKDLLDIQQLKNIKKQ